MWTPHVLQSNLCSNSFPELQQDSFHAKFSEQLLFRHRMLLDNLNLPSRQKGPRFLRMNHNWLTQEVLLLCQD